MKDWTGDAEDLAELDRLVAQADAAMKRSNTVLDHARQTATPRELQRVDRPAEHAVSIQKRSANPKLAPQASVEARSGRNRYEPLGPYCASTYVSIAATCPSSCTFKDNGCFAQAGAQHLTMGRLDAAGRRARALEVTRAEASALLRAFPRVVPRDGAKGGRDLRLHVGGDTSCEKGAFELGQAVGTLRRRGLGAAWTYTHRWREIQRRAWGPISVLASCETPAACVEAADAGYAPALTVEAFPRGSKAFDVGGLRGIPCPFEASGRKRTCVQCRLCLDRDLLSSGIAIVFAAHGSQAEAARARLRIIYERGQPT